MITRFGPILFILPFIFRQNEVSAFTILRTTKIKGSFLFVGEYLASDLTTAFNATNSISFQGYPSSDDWFSDPKLDDDDNEDKSEISSYEFLTANRVDKPSDLEVLESADLAYPFAGMLRNSAPYIADHSHRTAVFYLPGEYMDTPNINSDLGDICLAWLLGLKIVLVVGCRYDNDGCNVDFGNEIECVNAIGVTDDDLLRKVEEEAGFIRFEIERVLNRHLKHHGGISSGFSDQGDANGNVVGGTFYTARPFGVIDHVDYKNTGYPSKIYTERIEACLNNNDIVLLSTIGTSRLGDVVNVNGNHLAATVAAALKARKLVFLSNSGTIMREKGSPKTMQEMPLKFAKLLLKHYGVLINQAGFVAFKRKHDSLDQGAIELLLHLAWSVWALDQGVNRAHIVNPGDGSLLEELFSSKLGVNTCLYREDEAEDLDL